MTGRRKNEDYIHQPRRDSMYEDRVHDPYQARGKLPEPTACPDCGAVFAKGRWQWGEAPADANKHRCPACSRIHDRVPAALLTVSGEFFNAHKDEIMSLIHHTEQREKAGHALERIMGIDEQPADNGVVISYTGIHLAKSTGEALHSAYQGEFNFEYSDRDGVLHASWQR